MRKDFLRSNDLESKQSQPDEIWDGETRNRLRLWDREDACHVSSNLECLTSMAVLECRGGSVCAGAEKGEHLSICLTSMAIIECRGGSVWGEQRKESTWAHAGGIMKGPLLSHLQQKGLQSHRRAGHGNLSPQEKQRQEVLCRFEPSQVEVVRFCCEN